MRALGLVLLATGCYSGASAARDVNAAWIGHSRLELEGRLGQPTLTAQQPDGSTALRWIAHGINVQSLPSGYLDLKVGPTGFSVDAEAKAGVVEKYDYILANAVVAPGGAVTLMDSISLAAGIPAGTNIHTGAIMGVSASLAGFNDATSPRPSMDAYIGGMIGPRLALVGSYTFANGSGDAGWAMAHAATFGAQYWLAERLAVRAGAGAILDLDPDLKDATFAPGVVGAVSYAVIRAGSFALDARFNLAASTNTAFGMFGVGVNIN